MNQRQLKKLLRRTILGLFLLITLIFGQGKVHNREGFKISFPFGKKYDYNNILVIKVIDGDTIELENGERVRLIGIDTPEMYESDKLFRDVRRTGQDIRTIQKMGREAYEFTKQLCEGKKVRLELDLEKKDKYGRLLAYAYIDLGRVDLLPLLGYHYTYEQGTSIFVNATIIKSGFAYTMTIPPNVKYADLFRKLYQEARENKRGLWK